MDKWSNGAYEICPVCGLLYGEYQHKVMGVWPGVCAICDTEAGVSNAWHDWNMDDTYVENIIHLTEEKMKEDAEDVSSESS